MDTLEKLIENAVSVTTQSLEWNVSDSGQPIYVKGQIPPLPNPCPSIAVQGFTGKMGVPGSLESLAAELYANLSCGLNLAQRLQQSPITKWSGTNTLVVIPKAGKMWNAYFDMKSLKFFYNIHPQTKKVIYTASSADISVHELQHALTHAARPDLWGTTALECLAFHEAASDCMSILVALTHNEVIDYVLNETGGDLRKPSVLTKIAEDLGSALYSHLPPHMQRNDGLRNAVNDFKYVKPETLPYNTTLDKLGGECHNFSRVFTGAFHDLLVLIYEANGKTKEALQIARDQAGRALFRGISHAAISPQFFASVTRAMLISAGPLDPLIRQAFGNKNIPIPQGIAEEEPSLNVAGLDAKIVEHEQGTSVRVGGVNTVKLEEHLGISGNPLYSVDIDVPNEHYLEYDESNRLMMVVPAVEYEALEAAKICVDNLHENGLVSYEEEIEPTTEFSVIDNKLVRNYICCCK